MDGHPPAHTTHPDRAASLCRLCLSVDMDADTDATAEWLYDAVIRFLQVRRRRSPRPTPSPFMRKNFLDSSPRWQLLRRLDGPFPGGATRGWRSRQLHTSEAIPLWHI